MTSAPSALDELRSGWRVLLGAALGVGLGISGLLTYTAGLFFDGLAQDIGLSRTTYGAAFLASTVALAAAMPVVARMVDRYGPRTAAAVGAVALSLDFVALSQVESVGSYLAILAAIGFLAASSSPVPFTRAVAASFQRARGLALGLTQVGIGLAAALVPPLIAQVIAQEGWRTGFLALAACAALALVPIVLGLPGRSAGAAQARETAAQAFAKIRGSRVYLVQLAAFTSMALAFVGMLSHFVPMLREAGVGLERAGALAGLIGLSVIVTRIVVGWLADRLEPAYLGAASCALGGVGCVALAAGGPEAAPICAIALGAAMGAEADLIAILTARNFVPAAYSRAYATQYATFMLAGGLSPLWIGYLADVTGGYRMPLIVVGVALLVPIALFLRLPAVQAFSRDSRAS